MNRKERHEQHTEDLFSLIRAWRPIHEAMTAKVGFLVDGLHFEDDEDGAPKDSRYIRVIGEGAFNRWRHEIAFVTDRPTNVNPRPVDTEGDEDTAERAGAMVAWEVENPDKGFEDVFEEVVASASACGLGVATLEMLDDVGPWGEIIPVRLDPRNFMFDLGVFTPHDLRCKVVVERMRLTRDELLRTKGIRKSVVRKLKADDGTEDMAWSRTRNTESVARAGMGQDDKPEAEWSDADRFTVYRMRYRRTKETFEKPGKYTPFPDDDSRYMVCEGSGCGFRTQTQGEIEAELPDTAECPECGQTLHRVDGTEQRETLLAYPKGKCVLIAPYAGVDEALYEDEWHPKCRTFPYMVLTRFSHPFRAIGPDLAQLTWWNQVSEDMLLRLPLERMMASAPFLLMPKGEIEDAYGDPFQRTDQNGYEAYYTGDSMPQVQLVVADGIPAAWSAVYNALNSANNSNTGTADFGLAPGASRDIPASSVAQQIGQQSIPQEQYRRRYLREKGRFLGVILDYVKAYPDDRVMRLRGVDGRETVQAMRAADLPDFDFTLSDSPRFSQADEADLNMFDRLMQVAETKPWALELYAQRLKVSPSEVRRIRQEMARAQQEAQQAQMEAQAQAQQAPPPEQGGPMMDGVPFGMAPGMDPASLLAAQGQGGPQFN